MTPQPIGTLKPGRKIRTTATVKSGKVLTSNGRKHDGVAVEWEDGRITVLSPFVLVEPRDEMEVDG